MSMRSLSEGFVAAGWNFTDWSRVCWSPNYI